MQKNFKFQLFIEKKIYMLLSQNIQIEITPQWCKLWFILLSRFIDSLTVGSQIVVHTQMETGDWPNKPNTINL